MNPWEKAYRPKPLNPDLYSLPAIFAADGRLSPDHAAWQLTERDEAKHMAAGMDPLPEFRPSTGRHSEDRVIRGSCECGAAWRGELACHCGYCHLTFRSVTGFDEHRTAGRCRTTAELAARGLEPNEAGQWRHPRPEETIPGRTSSNG
jgi:hypothetical protein